MAKYLNTNSICIHIQSRKHRMMIWNVTFNILESLPLQQIYGCLLHFEFVFVFVIFYLSLYLYFYLYFYSYLYLYLYIYLLCVYVLYLYLFRIVELTQFPIKTFYNRDNTQTNSRQRPCLAPTFFQPKQILFSLIPISFIFSLNMDMATASDVW